MTPRGWLLFAAVSVVWGVPYLFIKLAVEDLSPGFVAWSRVALAALVLLPVAWRKGALRGLPLRWLAAFAFVRDNDAVPADRVRRAARLVVARRHPDRRRPAGDRVPGAALRPRRAAHPHALHRDAGRAGRRGGAGGNRHRHARLAAGGRGGGAGGNVRLRVRAADRQAPPDLPGTRSARSRPLSGSRRSCCYRSRSAGSRPRRPSGEALASVVVLGLVCTALPS